MKVFALSITAPITAPIIALVASTKATLIESSPPHPHVEASSSNSRTAGQAVTEPLYDRYHHYRQAHEQLHHLAKLDREAAEAASKKRSRNATNDKNPRRKNKPPSELKKVTYESVVQRRLKAKELGLHPDSGLPMFIHQTPLEEIKSHPFISSWNVHRKALEEGSINYKDMPPHFLSTRGEFKFLKPVKDGTEKNQRRWKKYQDRINAQRKVRSARLRELGLDRNSGVPLFAQKLTLEEIKKHEETSNWHQYRAMVEKGTLKQQDLPLHFTSPTGRLLFKIPKDKGKNSTTSEEVISSRKQVSSLQKKLRNSKAQELGLNTSSAIPIFAQRLQLEELKHHKEIENWHHYRSLIEKGEMKQENLPIHFKALRSRLTFMLNSDKEKSRTKERLINQAHQSKDDDEGWKDYLDDHNFSSEDEVWDTLRSQLE